MAIKMMGKDPNSLNDCAKLHPIIVSKIIAKDLPVFWSPRQSLRRQNSDAVVEKKPVVKKERKKACLQCSCSLGKCSNTKVLYGSALMHFSMHQLKGDNDSEICAYCGKDHDEPTTTTNHVWSLGDVFQILTALGGGYLPPPKPFRRYFFSNACNLSNFFTIVISYVRQTL